MEPEAYKTLAQENSADFVIHKSRFIGYGCPCKTEEEALAFLSRIRSRHKDATHNCYAYIIGKNSGIMRYSDDGEPGGTAGMPIIEVMRARGVVDCAVVVTRYFGGILLGAGGLVRAYAQGSKTALDAAGVVVMRKSARLIVEVSYSCWQRLDHYLKTSPCMLLESQFGTTVVATLLVRCDQLDALTADIIRLSEGQAEMLPDGELYYPWPDTPENAQ